MADPLPYDPDAAVEYARKNKSTKKWGEGKCAQRTMNAIEYGLGLEPRTLGDRPNSAYQFAPMLTEAKRTATGDVEPGFVLKTDVRELKKGDIAIVDPIPEMRMVGPWRDAKKAVQPIAPHGHMAIYDGKVWISDHVQDGGTPATRNLPYPGQDYRLKKPRVRILRHKSQDTLDVPTLP